jgi:hypothetical protein
MTNQQRIDLVKDLKRVIADLEVGEYRPELASTACSNQILALQAIIRRLS